jgi:hypothetical protein
VNCGARIERDLAKYRYRIPLDDGFRPKVEPTPDNDNVVIDPAVDASGTTDDDDRFVRCLALRQRVVFENPQVNAVATKAFPKALHALTILLAPFLACLLHTFAPLLASLLSAFAAFLAKFGGVRAA